MMPPRLTNRAGVSPVLASGRGDVIRIPFTDAPQAALKVAHALSGVEHGGSD
jgi:4-hydroxy-3-methylbut-2-en-1-yl diphosphate synthase IspG/GcpE